MKTTAMYDMSTTPGTPPVPSSLAIYFTRLSLPFFSGISLSCFSYRAVAEEAKKNVTEEEKTSQELEAGAVKPVVMA